MNYFRVLDLNGIFVAMFVESADATRFIAESPHGAAVFMEPEVVSPETDLKQCLRNMRLEPQSRELSCAITRAEEALHWLQARTKG